MSGLLDVTARGLANDLISMMGKDVTYRRVAEVYNPSTGATVATPTEYAVHCILALFTAEEIGASMAEAADTQLLFAASELPIVPARGDEVVIDSATYKVITDAQIEWSGAQHCLYRVRAQG